MLLISRPDSGRKLGCFYAKSICRAWWRKQEIGILYPLIDEERLYRQQRLPNMENIADS